MYRNNFDISSTGVNIEFSGHYDNDLGWIEFNDNIDVLGRDRRGDACLCFYTDYGQLESPQIIGDVFKIKKGTTKAEILNLDYWYNQTLKDIKHELLSKSIKDFENYIDVLELKKDFEILDSRGYSQGDYCKVLINKKALKNLWGNKPVLKLLNEDIDHLLWDSPITANFTINGTCYDYELDRYSWKREEFIEQVSKDSGVNCEVLSSITPLHLDYN